MSQENRLRRTYAFPRILNSPPLEPGSESRAAHVDSVQEQAQGFRLESDLALAGLAWRRPAERAALEPFGREPKPGSIEAQQFDARVSLVDEDEERVAGQCLSEVFGGGDGQAVEALAHVAGLYGEIDLERGHAEPDHLRPPFR